MDSEKITACECPASGWCARHNVDKNDHWVFLCRTRADYFQMWEQGVGPGQAVPAAGTGGQNPSILGMAWNLATSLAAFVADGCKTVTAEEYKQRLEICSGCDQRYGNNCLKCGCNLPLKAHGRAFECPLAKWPMPSEHEEGEAQEQAFAVRGLTSG